MIQFAILLYVFMVTPYESDQIDIKGERETFFAVDKINVLCVFLLPSGCLLPSSNSSFPQVLVLRYVVIKASSMTVL